MIPRSLFGALACSIVLATMCSAQGLRFSELRPLPTDHSGTIAVGEFDRLAGPDVVLNPSRTSRSTFYSNLGGGAFQATDMALPIPAASLQAIGDVDNDGDDDIVRASPGTAPLLLSSDGTGGFAPTSAVFPAGSEFRGALALRDLDGDGWLDLVVGSLILPSTPARVGILRGSATGVFTLQPFPLAIDTQALALVDGDGDGDPDLYLGASTTSSNDRYLTNVGSFQFVDSTNLIPNLTVPKHDIVSLDIDADLDPDLVLVQSDPLGQTAFLVLANTSGRFSVRLGAIPYTSNTALEVVPGDVDLDGDVDLVLDEATPDFGVLRNDGTGTFTVVRQPVPHRGTLASEMFVVDVDGDSDLDVLRPQLTHVELMRNDGTGTWIVVSTRTTREFLRPVHAYHAVDLDADTDLDVVAASPQGPTVFVNDGRGELSSLAGLPTNLSCYATDAADVDGDGDVDLVFGGGFDPFSSTIESDQLWLRTATGYAVSSTFPTDAAATGAVLLRDFTGSGRPDFVGTDENGALRFYRNTGGGLFVSEPSRVSSAPQNLVNALAGDVDGDNDLDLVVSDGVTDTLLRNVGGSFQLDPTFLPPTRVGSRMALVDIDGDTDLDLLLANTNFTGASDEVLLLNDGLGTFTRSTTNPPSTVFTTIDLETGDFDGDGDIDVVLFDLPTVFAPRGSTFFENLGAATFQERTDVLPWARGLVQETLEALDLDQDGDLDLLFGSDREENRVYWNLRRQLYTANTPAINKPSTLRLHSNPLDFYVLLASAGPNQVFVPGLGVIGLDLATLAILTSGILDGAGEGRVTLAIPAIPGLIGQSAYLQASFLTGGTPLLSNTVEARITNL